MKRAKQRQPLDVRYKAEVKRMEAYYARHPIKSTVPDCLNLKYLKDYQPPSMKQDKQQQEDEKAKAERKRLDEQYEVDSSTLTVPECLNFKYLKNYRPPSESSSSE